MTPRGGLFFPCRALRETLGIPRSQGQALLLFLRGPPIGGNRPLSALISNPEHAENFCSEPTRQSSVSFPKRDQAQIPPGSACLAHNQCQTENILYQRGS